MTIHPIRCCAACGLAVVHADGTPTAEHVRACRGRAVMVATEAGLGLVSAVAPCARCGQTVVHLEGQPHPMHARACRRASRAA